jgi:hypothetical protein
VFGGGDEDDVEEAVAMEVDEEACGVSVGIEVVCLNMKEWECGVEQKSRVEPHPE